MNDVCKEKHKRVDEMLNSHELRLNTQDDRIDKLEVKTEQYQSKTEVQIANLCEQIKSLVSTLKWFMGFMIMTGLGFIIWYIQQLER